MDDLQAELHSEVSSCVQKAKTLLKDSQTANDSIYQALEDVICLLPKSHSAPSNLTLQTHRDEAQKIFISEHYSCFVELLAEQLSMDWLQSDDSGRCLVSCFDRCLLLGPDEESFLTLTHIIATKSLCIGLLHCINLLESLLKSKCLSRVLQRYCCEGNSLPSGGNGSRQNVFGHAVSQLPLWEALLTAVSSLPDVVLAKSKSNDVGDFFFPGNFIPFVGTELMTVLSNVYEQILTGCNVSLCFLGAFCGKVSIVGFAELLWKSLITALEVKCMQDFVWRRIVQRLISHVSDRSIESVVVQLVVQTSSYTMLQSLLGTLPLVSTKMSYILTHKLILVRCYDGPRAVHVLHNIAGYLARTSELLTVFNAAFCHLLEVWANASSLRHRPLEQSLYLCKAVVAFISFAPAETIASLRASIVKHLLDGLPGYLGSSVPAIRQMGSIVAEKLSGAIHREIEGEPLQFGLEKNEIIDSILELCVLPNPDTTNSNNCDLSPDQNGSAKVHVDSFSIDTAKQSDIPANSVENKNGEITKQLDSDDDEDFSQFKPYPVFATEPENPKRPLYLGQCIEGLLKQDDPESVEQSLIHVESLVCHTNAKAVSEIAVELCRVLLHLDNQFALVNFTLLRHRALVSLTVACSTSIAEYLGAEFYARNYSIRQRMDILDVLASAASQLAEPTTLSKSKPTLQESDSIPVGPLDIIRQRLETKTRRFGRTRPLLAASASRFAPVAGSFFYPLLKHFDDCSDACLDLLGTDHLVLERLLYALGSIVMAATGAPCVLKLSMTLIEFVRCVHYHGEAGVRRAALYAVCASFASLPPETVLDDLLAMSEVGDWLRNTTQCDPDSECQKRAAQGILLLSSSIQQTFHSLDQT